MFFILKNEKGYVGAMMVIAVAAIVGIMIVGITHKMGDLTKAYDKSRAFYDAELAIEKFSISLKNAYDRANYLTDIRPENSGSVVNADFGCPGKMITLGSSGLNAVKLCWEFNGTGSGLCTRRSRESGGVPDICLKQGDLQVRIQDVHSWEVVVQSPEMSEKDKWLLVRDSIIGAFRDLAISEAHANLDAFKPLLPAVKPANTISINNSLNSLSRPESPDCSPGPANPYQCLKVAFCVKSTGICTPEEMIRQTYLFAKPATTTQGW